MNINTQITHKVNNRCKDNKANFKSQILRLKNRFAFP